MEVWSLTRTANVPTSTENSLILQRVRCRRGSLQASAVFLRGKHPPLNHDQLTGTCKQARRYPSERVTSSITLKATPSPPRSPEQVPESTGPAFIRKRWPEFLAASTLPLKPSTPTSAAERLPRKVSFFGFLHSWRREGLKPPSCYGPEFPSSAGSLSLKPCATATLVEFGSFPAVRLQHKQQTTISFWGVFFIKINPAKFLTVGTYNQPALLKEMFVFHLKTRLHFYLFIFFQNWQNKITFGKQQISSSSFFHENSSPSL